MSITTILDECVSYGIIRYFKSDRCLNNYNLQKYNKWKISANEIVTFDCGLMDMSEIYKDSIENEITKEILQVLAIIIRPEIEKSYLLDNDKRFDFCGYDLVELTSYTSAITNCGAGFEKVIKYENLNNFGLFSSFRDAVFTQLKLNEEYPEDSHAFCDIIEIWRYIK